MIGKIVAAPKKDRLIKKQENQEADMRNDLAELIAIKLIGLAELGDICGEGEETIDVSWGGALMRIALEKFRSPEWRSKQRVNALYQKAADAAKTDGAAALVPNVIPFNEKIEPQATVKPIVVQPEIPIVETTHWDPWLESVKQASRDECLAKHVFRHACLDAYGKAVPVAIETHNGKLMALATRDILPGGLVIPVLCLRDSSILDKLHGDRSKDVVSARKLPCSVEGSVKWKQPVDESYVRDVEINICCQFEPMEGYRKFCNPFWYIRRSTIATRCNSRIVGIKTKVITSAPMPELKTDSYHHKPGLLDFEVTIPCIVNDEKITGGTEIVLERLEWSKKVKTCNQKRMFCADSADSEPATKCKKITRMGSAGRKINRVAMPVTGSLKFV